MKCWFVPFVINSPMPPPICISNLFQADVTVTSRFGLLGFYYWVVILNFWSVIIWNFFLVNRKNWRLVFSYVYKFYSGTTSFLWLILLLYLISLSELSWISRIRMVTLPMSCKNSFVCNCSADAASFFLQLRHNLNYKSFNVATLKAYLQKINWMN
jgi:hypothetical protein